MSTVVIVDSYRGAFVNFRAQLLDDLVAKGHDVTALAPDIDADFARRVAARKVDVESIHLDRTGANAFSDIRSLWSLCRRLRRLRPDVLMLYSSKPIIYGAIAGHFAGVKTTAAFITGLGYAFGPRSGLGRVVAVAQKILYALSLRCCDIVFFQNPDDLRVFRGRRILATGARTELIGGSGVDVRRFAPAPFPMEVAFLMIGRLLRAKGVEEYCEAASSLRGRYPGVKFRLAGWLDVDNPDSLAREEFEALVKNSGVEFLGRLEDVRPALAQCSVYVLPSHREGTPRSTLEALAIGRAVVTTDAPGCRETVIDGVNGFLVPVDDHVSLARAMERFIAAPELISVYGKKSRELCELRFDVKNVNRKILAETGLGDDDR